MHWSYPMLHFDHCINKINLMDCIRYQLVSRWKVSLICCARSMDLVIVFDQDLCTILMVEDKMEQIMIEMLFLMNILDHQQGIMLMNHYFQPHSYFIPKYNAVIYLFLSKDILKKHVVSFTVHNLELMA